MTIVRHIDDLVGLVQDHKPKQEACIHEHLDMIRGHDVDAILILDVLHGIHGQNHRTVGRVLLHQIRNRHLGQTLSLTERRSPALG